MGWVLSKTHSVVVEKPLRLRCCVEEVYMSVGGIESRREMF